MGSSMKSTRFLGLTALTALLLLGCGGGQSQKPINATSFQTQWVKVGDRDMILISWLSESDKFRYNEVAALKYGSSEDSSNGVISVFNVNTKDDCVPTDQIVVDPKQVCSDLEKLKLKAKTKDGWVDIPVPPVPINLDKYWRQSP